MNGTTRIARSEEQPGSAEFAVTVIDPYQGQGVGSALLERLIELARTNDINTLTGSVLPSNTADILFRLEERRRVHTPRIVPQQPLRELLHLRHRL